jgi:hypothetical protein
VAFLLSSVLPRERGGVLSAVRKAPPEPFIRCQIQSSPGRPLFDNLISMNAEKHAEIFIELLRVGLISIRNLSSFPKKNNMSELMLREWSELCHSVPPILMGRCDTRAVRYFVDGNAQLFLRNYPSKQDADFLQVSALIDELNTEIR